jgi:hypothetical protein
MHQFDVLCILSNIIVVVFVDEPQRELWAVDPCLVGNYTDILLLFVCDCQHRHPLFHYVGKGAGNHICATLWTGGFGIRHLGCHCYSLPIEPHWNFSQIYSNFLHFLVDLVYLLYNLGNLLCIGGPKHLWQASGTRLVDLQIQSKWHHLFLLFGPRIFPDHGIWRLCCHQIESAHQKAVNYINSLFPQFPKLFH